MPEVGFQALAVLFLLLPGFFCARIVQSLCVRRDQTELDKFIEALLYAFLVYVAYAIFFEQVPLALRVEHLEGSERYHVETSTQPLLILLAIALFLGLVVAYLHNNDTALRLLRRARFTQKTSRTSLWNDAFHTFAGYVQVELADGRSVLGWLRFYSDTPEESSLFLEDAAWVDAEGHAIDIPGPGILLTKESGIRTILFLKGRLSHP